MLLTKLLLSEYKGHIIKIYNPLTEKVENIMPQLYKKIDHPNFNVIRDKFISPLKASILFPILPALVNRTGAKQNQSEILSSILLGSKIRIGKDKLITPHVHIVLVN